MVVVLRLNALKVKLSSKELREISQEINRHFTPIFAAKMAQPTRPALKLSPHELRAISEEISREFPPDSATQSTNLVLLAVDPGVMHAYWHIAKNNADITTKSQMTLRLYSTPKRDKSVDEEKLWQDIPLQHDQKQHKIHLPVLASNSDYSAVIGEHHIDGRFTTLAHSNRIIANSHSAASHQNRAKVTLLQTTSKNLAKNNTSGLGILSAL